MDKRQIKTKNAIVKSFLSLLPEQDFNKISVQEIVDRANIGRSTFYLHFESKEALLDYMCQQIIKHIFDSAKNIEHNHGHSQREGMPNSLICHIIQHIKENDNNILTILSCQGNEYFLVYLKEQLKELMYISFIKDRPQKLNSDLPVDLVMNHISGSFIEMIQWWIKNGLKESPEELDSFFTRVITQGC
ncbi:MAG: TetR/AcrR family transcriptional regulator [Treponemataceae bacterium]